MKTFNKTILLAAVLASAANAGVNISGDATMGLNYFTKNGGSTGTADEDNQFVVNNGESAKGLTHINFSATEGGKNADGTYAFVETTIDLDSGGGTAVSLGNGYVGYKGKRFDVKMGSIDSLTYQWVGSLNDKVFLNNIAITPVFDEDVANVFQATTKLGPATLGLSTKLADTTYDYSSYDLGAKFTLAKLDLAVVHQEVNENVSQYNILSRSTTSGSLNYAFKNLTSTKFLKDLELTGTYAHYNAQTTANSGRQSDKDAFSVGLTLNNTLLMYQTGIQDNREQWNLQHLRPISKNTTFGVSGQLATNYYDIPEATDATNNNDTALTRPKEGVSVFLTTTF